MSITAEDIRRRIAESQQPRQITADDVRRRIAAAEQASQVGTQGMGAPSGDERTFAQRATAGAAAVAEPWARLVEGFSDLTGAPPETMGAVQRGREAIEQEAAGSEGRMAGNIVGDVATMMAPGSAAYRLTRAATAARPFVGRVAPITSESAALGSIEATKMPREGGTRLGQGAATAGANLLGGAGQALIRSVVTPRMYRRTPMVQEEMQALQGAGIEPNIPMSMGQPGRATEGAGPISKLARWMHRRPLAAIPPTQGIIQNQQERALGDWRQMILQKTVPKGVNRPVPPPDSLRPMEDSMEAIDNWYSAEYRQLLDPFQFNVTTPTAPVADALNKASAGIAGQSVKRKVDEKLGDLLAIRATNGQITGSDVSALKTSLRREAKLAQDGAEKQAYYDLIEAIDDGVETQLRQISPKIADDYERLRGPYRNFITVDDAVGRTQFGEFSPKDLESASQRKATSERINRRSAPLRREAQRAMAIYDVPKNTESNIFQLLALGGATYGGMQDPVTGTATAGAYLAAGLGMLPRGTRWMAGEMPYQQALSRLLRKPGIEELSRAARISGGQYLAE